MPTRAEILMDLAGECVAPIWASRAGNEPAAAVDHNGTVTFLDLGNRKVAVTALHVVEKYREILTKSPEAALAVSLGSGVAPGFVNIDVIAEDPALDLAVLDLPDISAWRGHTKRYFPIAVWPIPSAQRGDPVTIVGFPGINRKVNGSIGIFSAAGIGMRVSNAPGRNVMLVDESNSLRTTENGVTRPGGINPGGLSGAAGFFFKDDRFHIAGFVYEGSEQMLFLTPGTRLQADGSLTA